MHKWLVSWGFPAMGSRKDTKSNGCKECLKMGLGAGDGEGEREGKGHLKHG